MLFCFLCTFWAEQKRVSPLDREVCTHAYVSPECPISRTFSVLYCRAVISGLRPCSSSIVCLHHFHLSSASARGTLGLTICANGQGVSFAGLLNTVMYALSQEHPLERYLSFTSVFWRSTHFFPLFFCLCIKIQFVVLIC